MTPGRELDALVALKVMGWEEGPVGVHLADSALTARECWFNSETGKFIRSKGTWAPSTDIKAAWQVVEKLSVPNPYNILEDDNLPPIRINALIRLEDGRWMARIDRAAELESYYERSAYKSDKDFAIADTAPLAICLASLKAVGVKV